MAFDSRGLDDYNDVPARIAEFRAKHPEGSLQPANLSEPFKVMDIGGQTFIVYIAAAYRAPDDPKPGIGCAYEFYPGRTPYTKGSELQNAETSAWGRAIVAVLAADTKKGIATREEVRNRSAEYEGEPSRPAAPPAGTDEAWLEGIKVRIRKIASKTDGNRLWKEINQMRDQRKCLPADVDDLRQLLAVQVEIAEAQASHQGSQEPTESSAA